MSVGRAGLGGRESMVPMAQVDKQHSLASSEDAGPQFPPLALGGCALADWCGRWSSFNFAGRGEALPHSGGGQQVRSWPTDLKRGACEDTDFQARNHLCQTEMRVPMHWALAEHVT